MVEIPVRCGLLGTEQGDSVASGEKSPAQGNSSTPVGPSRGAGQARSHGRQPAGTAFAKLHIMRGKAGTRLLLELGKRRMLAGAKR